MFRRKHKQIVKVIAIWNTEKKVWECKVKQKEICQTLDNKWRIFKNKEQKIVDECDEFVIPWAVLECNGINTKSIDEILENN